MTRENKLALVVGFGLILLVGILISDHFSTARSQEPAELAQAVDPLRGTRAENPDLIAMRARPAPRRPGVAALDPTASDGAAPGGARIDDASARATRGRVVDPVVPDTIDAIEMGGPGGGFGAGGAGAIGLPPAVAEELPYTFHDVRPGEALSRICRAHYGDASLAAAVAKYNGLTDPNAIQAGTRLRLPRGDDLVRGRATAAPAARPPAPSGSGPETGPEMGPETGPRHATYTVKDDDVLSSIAQRLLGSARKYHLIFEHNRDQLDSPDDLRPGMTLRIPQ
jgi:nucleoid-associated protein YgaU